MAVRDQAEKGATFEDSAALFESLGVDKSRLLMERSSRNTEENAKFSKVLAAPKSGERWWLVTSAYHMPRALAEISHQLPDVTLIPFPVVSDRLRLEPWWSNGTTTRLVLSEYFKYLYAHLRMRFDDAAVEVHSVRFAGLWPHNRAQ